MYVYFFCILWKQIWWTDFIICLQKVIRKIEASETDSRDKPKKDVVIKDAGVEEVAEPFSVEKADAEE